MTSLVFLVGSYHEPTLSFHVMCTMMAHLLRDYTHSLYNLCTYLRNQSAQGESRTPLVYCENSRGSKVRERTRRKYFLRISSTEKINVSLYKL